MGYDYTTGLGSFNNTGMGSFIWLIVAFILSLIGCFVIYFLFVKKENKLNNKVLEWLRSFLRFDTILIETILKIVYIFVALFITLGSFSLIGINFVSFLTTLIVGNLVARITHELILITIMIWKNTSEIKNSLKKK